MGRIEEALRKAKAIRQGNIERTAIDASRIPQDSAGGASQQRRKSTLSQIRASNIVPVDNQQLREQRVIAALESDARVGHYRQLRTQLLKTMRDNLLSTLAITSAHEGAGKTLTAANLAISLSMDVSTTVLLVDLDLNTPSIHQILNLSPEKGLVDFLEGQAELDEILFDPGFDRLTWRFWLVVPPVKSRQRCLPHRKCRI